MNPSSTQQLKSEIRNQIREVRRSINKKYSLNAGLNVTRQLIELESYRLAKNIACFLSFDGEINTTPLIKQIQQDKRYCLLPKLRPSKPNRLWFFPFEAGEQLLPNRLGIPEVQKSVNFAIAPSKIDLLLMPLVSFDEHGNRLGMGGGYYDATLAHLVDEKNKSLRPTCIGLAFEQQKVEKIPVEKWDYPLDGVLTEKQLYLFNRK
ncbi:5-formyltetrahydrofolate cyclo-ligase [Aliikangiella sp. G2MR2-5]|uniref:5-formyltetrahydrofolate cyclo-ligase n=1 Tax=Aliikangiella sp. G2MR2-5 TaxID=2788943 RepID=UPI001AEE2B5A|nr:5-formyltetrahydrofolate cyclo-ligase [Aliikangiella sp. G2MR2-5]